MKLIGVGLPRTGTLSQKVALEMLGVGPCYHMVNVLGDLDNVEPWRRAVDGDIVWSDIFDGFESTVDWPGSYFYRELMDVYPDAKMLLSVRDPDAWAQSMRDTIWTLLYGQELLRHISETRRQIDPKWRAFTDLMCEMWQRSGLLNGPDTTLEWMSTAIQRYQDEVQDTVPAERLLVWSPADGWGPLCEFLEVPVPDMPFPHLNDSGEFVGRIIDGALITLTEWRAQQRQDAPARRAAAAPAGAAAQRGSRVTPAPAPAAGAPPGQINSDLASSSSRRSWWWESAASWWSWRRAR